MVCTSRETPGSLPAFDTLPKNMPDNGLSFFLIVWIMSSSFRNFSDAHDLVPISSRALQSSCVFVMPNISRSILPCLVLSSSYRFPVIAAHVSVPYNPDSFSPASRMWRSAPSGAFLWRRATFEVFHLQHAALLVRFLMCLVQFPSTEKQAPR